MKRILFLSAICALALLSSCTDEFADGRSLDNNELIAINIDSEINQVHTKVNSGGFVDQDALGLFAVNYINGQPGQLRSSGNQADNVKYVFDEAQFKWTPNKPVYFKDVNTNVDLYAYYPFQEKVNDVDDSNFEVKQNQATTGSKTELSGYEASDFLWGKAENITPTEAKIKLSFSHKMASVSVKLKAGDGFSEDEFEALEKTVMVTGTTRKASIDFSTGEVTPIGGAQQTGIVMSPQEDASFRAVVVPQSLAAGTQLFSITINGISYSFKKSSDEVTYQPGKLNEFTITLKKKSLSGDIELELDDFQITEWTEDRNAHGGEARQYFVVNVEEPGTLGEVIENAGKNPAKIKNLKVTGEINANDFYFMRDNMAILQAVNLHDVTIAEQEVHIPNYQMDINGNVEDVGVKKELVANYIPANAFLEKKTLCYFVFPEEVKGIGDQAFYNTKLIGSLVLPNGLTDIGLSAFSNTNVTSVQFPDGLENINTRAFCSCSSLSGELNFPESLKYIGVYCFANLGLSGKLILPDNLIHIGQAAFSQAGAFTGDLIIPEKIRTIGQSAFFNGNFTGHLYLNNVTSIGETAFYNCTFRGELVIPEGITEISKQAFDGNHFTKVILPSTLQVIKEKAFIHNYRLESVEFNEGLMIIGESAFYNATNLLKLDLPSSLILIQGNAFSDCYYVSSITCAATDPPQAQSSSFNGIGKDNFTVEVPESSVVNYQTQTGWSDFKRFSGHYDFSISRSKMQGLNSEITRTFLLRAPSGYSWSIEDKPDWVTVTPSSGTGKTEVSVTFDEMLPSDVSTFQVNEGSEFSPSYKTYDGRGGEIIFKLDEKNHTNTMKVEQFDTEYHDGQIITHHTATKGNGIDIVFIGEGYGAKDIADGIFHNNVNEGITHFFGLEPYKSYMDYFNVYEIPTLSMESGIGTINTIIDDRFGSYYSSNRLLIPGSNEALSWAQHALPSMDLTKSLVIMLMNASAYEGVTQMYGDGSALACCPISTDEFPYDFRGLIQHEAGGHGFGKLADEYIYHNAFIQNCVCQDGCDHPKSEFDTSSTYGQMKLKGWFKNVSLYSDVHQVPWSHLFFNPDYSDKVDMYEGAYMHSRGVFRSEVTSCMNNNIPYYSAISRQAIVERIMECAGETFDIDEFYANDSFEVGTKAEMDRNFDYTFGVDPKFSRGTDRGPIYAGEHPIITKF